MTAHTTLSVSQTRPRRDGLAVHADAPLQGQALPLGAVAAANQLLDGGEVVIFALKPSLWFIPLVSGRWIAAMVLVIAAVRLAPWSQSALPLMQLAIAAVIVRMAWATMQWSTRLYVLTNRRVMRVRGVFNVELFECALTQIQNTWLSLSLPERIVRIGTIHVSTAADGGNAAWRMLPRPREIHEQLCDAIRKTRNRNHGV